MKKVIVSKKKPTKFIIKERYTGTKKATEVFSDFLLSEISKKDWNLEQKYGIIITPTIPKQVVPNERR